MASDVVVLGGGFAGLSCAAALAERGLRAIVVEKKPHLGGRAYSFTDPETGHAVDNGQHLFMGCYRQTRIFLERIGASGKLSVLEDIRVDFADAQARRASLRCPTWLGSPLHFAAGVMGLDGLSWGDKLGLGRLRPLMDRQPAEAFDHLTVRQWLDSLGQSRRIQERLFDPISLGVLNENPEVAAATGLIQALRDMFLRGVDGSRLALSNVGLSELYAQDAQSFIEKRGGRVLFSKNATGLIEESGRVTGVALENGEHLKAGAVVSSLPAWDLARINLPHGLGRTWEALKPAPIVSVSLWLDRPLLDRPLVGMLGTETHWVFNKSRIFNLDGPGQYLSLVISGAHGQVLRPPEELLELAKRDLARCFPGFHGIKVRRGRVIKEPRATLSPIPGTEALRPKPGEACPGFFLAGDWTRTGLPATIESAAASGHAAAEAVMKKGKIKPC